MTTHVKLDLDKANELLEAAIHERGEGYVYPFWEDKCEYVFAVRAENEAEPVPANTLDEYDLAEASLVPGCIVGHVYAAAGVPLELLAQADGDVDDMTEQLRDDWDIDVEFDQHVRDLLTAAQRSQDQGVAWSEAVAYARQGKCYVRPYRHKRADAPLMLQDLHD